MRLSLLAAALLVVGLVVGACTPRPPMSAQNNRGDLDKYVEPTNGAAYSQSDVRYYLGGSSLGYTGRPK